MVHLSGGDINLLFETLKDWENILQAEKTLLNNEMSDTEVPTSSEQEVS